MCKKRDSKVSALNFLPNSNSLPGRPTKSFLSLLLEVKMKFITICSVITVCGLFFVEPILEAQQRERFEFHSQAGQDEFVYSVLYGVLDKQDQGYYLEIGAERPIVINNTYFFEKNLRWSGVSLDISTAYVGQWLFQRKNPLLVIDATKANYDIILKDFPQVIDYLSLDIDGNYDIVLERLSKVDHIFKVITIEHDAYRYGDQYRKKEREMLSSLGYYLLCSNVRKGNRVFEDWWIHPQFFPREKLSALTSLDLHEKDCNEIVRILKRLMNSNR
jgi:hypothetical protein